MNSVAAKENRLKQVIGFPLNVFSTRFFYQAANEFADIKILNRLEFSGLDVSKRNLVNLVNSVYPSLGAGLSELGLYGPPAYEDEAAASSSPRQPTK